MGDKKFTFSYWYIFPVMLIELPILYYFQFNKLTIVISMIISTAFAIFGSVDTFRKYLGMNEKAAKVLVDILITTIIVCITYCVIPLNEFKLSNVDVVKESELIQEQEREQEQEQISSNDENLDSSNYIEEFLSVLEEPVEANQDESNFLSPESIKDSMNKQISVFEPDIDGEVYEKYFLTKTLSNVNDDELYKLQALYDKLDNNIIGMVGKEEPADSETLENDKMYSDLVNEAEILYHSIDDNASRIEKYIKVTELHEKAYKIGKTRALAILLARNYFELGMEYAKNAFSKDAFSSYIRSLEYYYDVIRLSKSEKNDLYKNKIENIIYKIGCVHHAIGDLERLSVNVREDAYYMTYSCFKYTCSIEKSNFWSHYFCGMIAHKLGLVLNKERNVLLDIALSYYEKSLVIASLKESTKLDIYKYCMDVCDEQKKYIAKYGHKEGMLLYKEYNQKIDDYSSKSKKIRGNLN